MPQDLENVIAMWGFPKIMGTILGDPIIRIIVFRGLYWVPLFWETTMVQGLPEQQPQLETLE